MNDDTKNGPSEPNRRTDAYARAERAHLDYFALSDVRPLAVCLNDPDYLRRLARVAVLRDAESGRLRSPLHRARARAAAAGSGARGSTSAATVMWG